MDEKVVMCVVVYVMDENGCECVWLYACVMDELVACEMCVWLYVMNLHDEEGCDAPACVCICVCHDRNDELPMFSPKCRFISISANFPALLGAKN